MARLAPARALLLLALLASSCATFRRERGVSFSSVPPGARVILDGKDSGFVTPCLLYLPTDENRTILELERPGYETATRLLLEHTDRNLLLWSDMEVYYNTWRFLLFLNFEDFFIPLKIDNEPHPARIFVRLKRAADQ